MADEQVDVDVRGGTGGAPAGDEASGEGKDPAEQAGLARDLGEELTDAFVRFVGGEIGFPELSFLTYETLQDLHVVASGAYELEYDDGDEADGGDGGYDRDEATEQQEELSQELAER